MSLQTTRKATAEPRAVRWALMTIGLGFLFFFLALPLFAVFVEAFAAGVPAYIEALKDPEARSAIWLTLFVAIFVLPFNVAFGVEIGRASCWERV